MDMRVRGDHVRVVEIHEAEIRYRGIDGARDHEERERDPQVGERPAARGGLSLQSGE